MTTHVRMTLYLHNLFFYRWDRIFTSVWTHLWES